MEDEKPRKELKIFGRDVSQIPCFRKSFLYGIGGGVLIGCLSFVGTSRVRLSSNIGFGSFFCGTFCYWFTCRYQWSKNHLQYQKLQAAMRKNNLYEGTDIERELLKEA